MKALGDILLAAELFGAQVVVSDDIAARLTESSDGTPLLVLEPQVPADSRRECCANLEILKNNQVCHE